MTEQQARIIETMGFDADDNSAFIGWMDEAIRNAQIANRQEGIDWFLGDGWPWPDSPVTDDDREALRAYIS